VISVQGTVDKIWHNHRADGSEYWVLSIDGQRYSTWDKNMVADIQEGYTVEFAFTDSGRYRNLTALKRLSGEPFITADRIAPSPESLRTVKMSCLRTAAEMLKDTTLLPEQKVSLAINMAERLENYVLRLQGAGKPKQATQRDNQDETESQDPKEGSRER